MPDEEQCMECGAVWNSGQLVCDTCNVRWGQIKGLRSTVSDQERTIQTLRTMQSSNFGDLMSAAFRRQRVRADRGRNWAKMWDGMVKEVADALKTTDPSFDTVSFLTKAGFYTQRWNRTTNSTG